STPLETSDDSLSDVPKNAEDLDSCDEDESSAEVLPSSSKVSVIPHDLFYYPHYNVPISAVLDAYVEPCLEGYDTENDNSCSETVTGVLHEEGIPAQNYKEDAPEPSLANKLGVPPSEIDTEKGEEDTMAISTHKNSSCEKEELLLIGEREIEKDGQKATNNEDSMILQHPEV
ncbi:CLMN protein, partial [Anseranas semipalmata]|nr:CLMN protein [Anseranas semipalmata]